MGEERLGGIVRCIGVDFAEPITSEAGIATASWGQQPLTLRSDALTIAPGDVTEREEFSHENDIAEDFDATSTGNTASGSFYKATMAQMKDLLGGAIVGTGDEAKFVKSGKIKILNKAIRFRLKSGGSIIIPNAQGFVNFDANLGAADGLLKLPFKFKSMAQTGFDCDFIYSAKDTVAPAAAPTAAPMSISVDMPETPAPKSGK